MKTRSVNELDRIRRDVGSSLRSFEVGEPAPPSLIALLQELEKRVRQTERDRVFAAVHASIAEMLRAAGKEPRAPEDTDDLGNSGPLRAA